MPSTANDRQVGGTHYQANEYQHWDFVTDLRLPYLLGVATKYVSRWRDKNGVEDLEKALHYLEKANERGVYPRHKKPKKTRRFANQHAGYDSEIIEAICYGNYAIAGRLIRQLISESAPETPTQESQG